MKYYLDTAKKNLNSSKPWCAEMIIKGKRKWRYFKNYKDAKALPK